MNAAPPHYGNVIKDAHSAGILCDRTHRRSEAQLPENEYEAAGRRYLPATTTEVPSCCEDDRRESEHEPCHDRIDWILRRLCPESEYDNQRG